MLARFAQVQVASRMLRAAFGPVGFERKGTLDLDAEPTGHGQAVCLPKASMRFAKALGSAASSSAATAASIWDSSRSAPTRSGSSGAHGRTGDSARAIASAHVESQTYATTLREKKAEHRAMPALDRVRAEEFPSSARLVVRAGVATVRAKY